MPEISVEPGAWFATCPKGLESLLAHELETLGAVQTREVVAGVHFDGPKVLAYRACLWSRLANRILWPLARVDARDADQLYQSLVEINWGSLFTAERTLAIDFSGENRNFRNTQFGAQRCKDAVVDWFQQETGARPSVDRRNPDVRLNVRLVRDHAHVAIDFSGASLHQRGYRLSTGDAPLKENLAAALLLRADWPGMAAGGGALIDPMCGAGTLLLEGAMMVADIAPGLHRSRFGFECLRLHDQRQWQALVSDARGRAERGRERDLPEIRGYDADPRVIRRAQENIERLQLKKSIRVSVKPLAELTRPTHRPLPHGLLICNPPYGERLGDKQTLAPVYQQLGAAMSREFQGWQAAVLTSDLELGKAIGLRSHKRYKFFNGALATTLLLFELENNTFREMQELAPANTQSDGGPGPGVGELGAGAQMFANRIRKNRKRFASWRKREGVNCYRLYDADMPEYAVAVDIYEGRVHVAEYRAPADVAPEAARRRMDEIRSALPVALDVSSADIVYKERSRQRGRAQYEKRADKKELVPVREGAAALLVNLYDYLDTGLFLDHRPLRGRIGAEAADRDFLNLYCYTGTASVHAALGRARSTTSVDLSNTYLDWARKNFAANKLSGKQHRFVKADCYQWLQDTGDRFDLILLDPPSFSNSSGMDGTLDIQRDHVDLLRAAMAVLRPGGVLYFSNNRRGFKLDPALEQAYACEDISSQTLDPDFQRHSNIHRCWLFSHPEQG